MNQYTMKNLAPHLYKHGEYAKLQYALDAEQDPDDLGLAGHSTDQARPDGNETGIVKRYKKNIAASQTPHTLDAIAQANHDALLYASASDSGFRGLSMMYGMSAFIFGIWVVFSTFDGVYLDKYVTFTTMLLWFIIPLFPLFTFYLFLKTARLELYNLIDSPIIFDRKHRKVYRVFSEYDFSVKGLFKSWPVRACEYDWDLIDAEHNAEITTTGSTVRRDNTLIFIVRKSAEDPTIIDSFTIGNPLVLVTGESVDAAYEYIRRFMQSNYPPPQAHELSPKPQKRKGLLASFDPMNPFSQRYWELWREGFGIYLIWHFLFPLSIPLGAQFCFFSWLSTKTAKPVIWPQEVVDAVGPEVAAPITIEIE